jgi:flagellar protein FliO/FliZ
MEPTSIDLFRILASLVLVFGLLGGLLWALKKMQSRLQRTGPHKRIAIIETLNLAPRQKIALVQVGQQQVLVGITPTQITALLTVTPSEANESPDSPPSLPHKALAELSNHPTFKEEMQRA